PNAYFLVPGYGAQGGTAADVKVCFNKDGLGAIVNSSRDIIFAWQKEDKAGDVDAAKNYAAAARRATEKMKKELGAIVKN
ncbi:MAG: Orotidine 5'-phosphate decarboxylase, partial [Candidatus Peregrinibacteria bacterium GW2011_GWA2_47_7]